MNMLKINKVSLVDNQFTDEELKTGGLCTLNADTAPICEGVWRFVKDGTATCVSAEIKSTYKTKPAPCEVEKLVLKLTKKVRREIPVAADQKSIDTGLKGLNGTVGKFNDENKETAAKVAVEIADISTASVSITGEAKDGVLTLGAGAKAGVLVVDLKVAVGEGVASHPSMDAAHKIKLDFNEKEPLHVVLYANAKNMEGAKPNVTDFHTHGSRMDIIKA